MLNETLTKSVTQLVADEPGITLADLLDRTDGVTNGDVFAMIVRGEVYVDLRLSWLGDEERVQVFRDRETAKFFQRLSETQQKPEEELVPRSDDLIPGTTLLWNGVPAEIFHIGTTDITLYRNKYSDFPTFPKTEFDKWIREGRVTNFSALPRIDRESEAYKIALRLESRAELSEALWKFEKIIKPHLEGHPITDTTLTGRTHRNLITRYEIAKCKWGNGLLGIVPQHHKKGNNTDRLKLIDPQLRSMLDDFIEKHVETPVHKTKTLSYGAFRTVCLKAGIKSPPCYKIFIGAIKTRAGAEQTEKIEGSKAAYQKEEFSDWDPGIPIHGDRPWEYAHVDHTLTDVILRHTDKGVVMGRAWITLLIDSYSRCVLAYYITYDSPSYRSCMGVFRECVRLNARLPECFIVDGGSEFRSIYFEKLLARYKCDIIWRPATKPRFGAVIERFIHTLNKQFLHNLLGNTKVTKNVRQMTKSVDPRRHAVWTLPMLDTSLEKYFYEEYANRTHSGLDQSPKQAFSERIEKFKLPKPKPIKYDEIFLIDTMPTTRKGTAKLFRSRGLKNFGIWYRSKNLRKTSLYGKHLEIRYDPWNLAHIYAWTGKEWVECYAPPGIYSNLKNRTERELKIYAEEKRQSYRAYGRDFNKRVEEMAKDQAGREESERVEKQRLQDSDMRMVAERKGSSLSPIGAVTVSPKGSKRTKSKMADGNTETVAKSNLKSFGRAMKKRKIKA